MQQNKKYKAILVDDEKAAREVLQQLIIFGENDIEIVDSCENLPDAILSIRNNKPDVVFLDVEMPQYAGYEIINFFDQIDFQIIFVTGFNEYAIKAFEMNAVDYLTKPVQRNRLKEAIQRMRKNHELKFKESNYQELVQKLKATEGPTFVFTESGKKHFIKCSEIIAVIAEGSYCNIQLVNGESLLISKNIGTIEKEICENTIFFRSHKSWIVNTEHIEGFEPSKEILILKGGIKAKLSRFKKSQFLELVNG